MSYYNTINIPFKIKDFTGNGLLSYTLQLRNERNSYAEEDVELETLSKIIDNGFSDFIAKYDEDTFIIPNISIKLIDPINDGNYVSIFNFITEYWNYGGKYKTEARILNDEDALIYDFIVNKTRCTFNADSYILKLDCISNIPKLNSYVFRQDDTANNPLDLDLGTEYKVTEIFDKIMYLLNGESNIDYRDDIDYKFDCSYWDDLEMTSLVTVEKSFDDLYIEGDLRTHIYGNVTTEDYSDIKNVSDLLIYLCNSFMLRAGIDENGDTFLYQKIQFDDLEEIPQSEIINISFNEFKKYNGVYVPYIKNDSHAYYGEVYFDNDGIVNNSAEVKEITLKLYFWNRTYPSMLYGDYYVLTGSSAGDPKCGQDNIKIKYSDLTELVHETNTDFVAYFEHLLLSHTYGLCELKLKGSSRKIFYNYKFKLYDLNGNYRYVTLYPIETRKNIFKNETSIKGYAIALDIFAEEPLSQPTNLVFSDVGANQMTLTWDHTSPAPTGYIVFRRTLIAYEYTPTDFVNYTIGQDFGDYGIVAYIGADNTFVDTGLEEDTTYRYRIFAFNDNYDEPNYKQDSPLTGQQITD